MAAPHHHPDAQDHADMVFKIQPIDRPCEFSLPTHPQASANHPGVALLRLNLVLLMQPDLIYSIGRETQYQGAETLQSPLMN